MYLCYKRYVIMSLFTPGWICDIWWLFSDFGFIYYSKVVGGSYVERGNIKFVG